MKDLFVFLMAYPLWVKTVVVALLSVCALLLLVFKPKTSTETSHPVASVSVTVGTNQGGNIAGRDVVINAGPVGAQTQELIQVLEARASHIQRDLAPHFQYAEVQGFLRSFQDLHASHIAALRRNNLIEAHEYLTQIHAVSRELERSEFWERHYALHSGRVAYSLKDDAFQRGKLVEWYAGRSAQEALVDEDMARTFGPHARKAAPLTTPELYARVAE
jgi:hypothetical protein